MKRDAFDPIESRQSQAANLTLRAHSLLLQKLESYGNGVSPQHAYALRQLLSGLTDQGLQINRGRIAYALPCGAGKTLSVVTWIAAQHQLGLNLSIAVSAQQITSLCDIKTALIELEIPEKLIGIRYARSSKARWPDTGDEDRPIMLGTHSRIKGADEVPTFCLHKGVPRDLLIWDESLTSSDAAVFELSLADTALAHFAKNEERPLIGDALRRLREAVDAESEALRLGVAASPLTLLSDAESEAALTELGHPYCASPGLRMLFEVAQKVLKLMKHTVSLLDVHTGGTGKGLMHYRIVIAPELQNIAVLDASFVVRELCKADPKILDGTTLAMRTFKSYEKVLVRQNIVPSGRCQFEGSKAERQKALQVAVKVIANIPVNEPILVFTYKEQRTANLIDLFAEELRAAGIDSEAKLPCGDRRISFSTWGKHTTENSYADCKHVLLLGVLRMPMLELGAAMAGQKDDLLFRMQNSDLRVVEYSELASNIMQAMNRGSCRKIGTDGKAHEMTVHLLTKEKALQSLLQKAMPGLQWETVNAEPNEMHPKRSRTQHATDCIVKFVQSLPNDVTLVSMQTIYKEAGIPRCKDTRVAALDAALLSMCVHAKIGTGSTWVKSKRSLIRRD